MRITKRESHKPGCQGWDRQYCQGHRLIFCLCLITDDEGFIETDCPRCNHEWDMKRERRLWEQDQIRRGNYAAGNS